jgi:hypothetical protein
MNVGLRVAHIDDDRPVVALIELMQLGKRCSRQPLLTRETNNGDFVSCKRLLESKEVLLIEDLVPAITLKQAARKV